MALGTTHFKNISSHKQAVLQLYRALLRVSSSSEQKQQLKHQFKQNKKLTSVWRVRDELERAESVLAEKKTTVKARRYGPQTVYVKKIVPHFVAIPCTAPILTKQQKQEQQLKARIRHILSRWQFKSFDSRVANEYAYSIAEVLNHCNGKPPNVNNIDLSLPVYQRLCKSLEHRHALKRFSTLCYVFNHRGPYKIRTISQNFRFLKLNYRFLRGPWKQHPMIHHNFKAVRRIQDTLLALTNQKAQYVKYERMEAEWEYRMSLLNGNPQDLATLIGQWHYGYMQSVLSIRNRARYFKRKINYFDQNREKLRLKAQESTNKVHEKRKIRFKQLEMDIDDNGGLRKAPLVELMQKHNL